MSSTIKYFSLTACLSLILLGRLSADQTMLPTPPTEAPQPVSPQEELQQLPPAVAHPDITQSADPGYILQPNDYVQVTVYQEDDLTTSTRVSPEGNITL